MKFVLVGPHAGKTISLGGHPFVDGVFDFGPDGAGVVPGPDEVAKKGRILAKLYQAYPEGSPELDAAKARIKGDKPIEGRLDVEKREDEQQAAAQPAGAGGSDRARQGAIRTALTKLDPKNADHWTSAGLPSVEAVRELSGDKEVSRGDIQNLAPKLTREEAAKLVADDGDDDGAGDPLDQ